MIKAVIFDFDGTITKPFLNFRRIKSEIGLPEDEIYLLEKMYELPDARRKRAFEILEGYEAEAVGSSELNEGVPEVLSFLKEKQIKTALLTRNSRISMTNACQKHGLCFDLIVTREDAPPKPKPDGIFFASRNLGIPTSQILLVGDYLFDIMAGKAAGVKTVLLTNGHTADWDIKSDYTIKQLTELISLIRSL